MKLNNKCSGECPVCSFRRIECNPEDNKCKFARAGKEELIRRLANNSYNNEEKKTIRVWLRIQHDINYI